MWSATTYPRNVANASTYAIFVWICLRAFNSQMSFYSSPCKNRTDIDLILYGWLCYKCRLSPSTSSHISANLWILEILPISVCTTMNIFTIKWQCRLLPCNTYRIHMDKVGYTVVMHLSIRQTCVLYWNERSSSDKINMDCSPQTHHTEYKYLLWNSYSGC